MKSVTVLLFTNDFLIVVMLVFSLIPQSELQYVTMAIQVVARAFVYSTAAAFTNAVYPTQHFGFIYGLTVACGGVVLLLQYPVTLIVTRIFNDNYDIVNGVTLAAVLVNLLHPIYLMYFINKKALIKIPDREGTEKVQ